MHGKEFIIDVIRTYFTVVTFINVIMWIVGTQIAPDNLFGYEAFRAPLVYGAVGVFPNIVMYSRRELSVKELWIRKALQLMLIEICVLFVVFHDVAPVFRQPEIVAKVGIGIVIIYVVSTIIDGIQDYLSAKKMTEELMKFQRSVEME